jgi:hypothetical protein
MYAFKSVQMEHMLTMLRGFVLQYVLNILKHMEIHQQINVFKDAQQALIYMQIL